MGRYSHFLSLDTEIMATIGEHVVIIVAAQYVTIATVWLANTLYYCLGAYNSKTAR